MSDLFLLLAFAVFCVLALVGVGLGQRYGLDKLTGHRTHILSFMMVLILAFGVIVKAWTPEGCAFFIAAIGGFLTGSKIGTGIRNEKSQPSSRIKPDPAEEDQP